MNIIGKTETGYTVLAIPPGKESPMLNHLGGEIAVDEESKTMFCWESFVILYGTESILSACNKY